MRLAGAPLNSTTKNDLFLLLSGSVHELLLPLAFTSARREFTGVCACFRAACLSSSVYLVRLRLSRSETA